MFHCLITGRNEVLAKVMFLHVSVILLTGGGPAPNFRGGRGACSKFSGGGVPAPNFGGVPAPNFGGGVPAPNFRGGLKFSEYGQRSAGTHPTGMHSCIDICI